jgi:hypothetical protein
MKVVKILLGVLLLWASWLGMMLVHEAGHAIGALSTGGTVQRVVWGPFSLSRTDVSPDPSPLLVAWAGPVIGATLPLLAMACLRPTRLRRPAAFFAGFCLIANGAYIGIGWLDRAGDAGEMVRLGSPQWLLITFGVITVASGLWIWHRLTSATNVRPGKSCYNPGDAPARDRQRDSLPPSRV